MEISNVFNRSKNLFPPILKDCSYRLLVNPLTWVLVVIMLLPCLLGLWVYYDYHDERQVEEVNGEKIYYFDFDGEGQLELMHENLREFFLTFSSIFIIKFIGVLIAIMFSSEMINEEFNRKTMQILRTTPIMPLEIIFYRYLTGVICMFSILASSSIIMYVILMLGSGIHGIIEELNVLWLVIKIVLFESVTYLGIFCLISAYFERPFLLGIVYWIIWEMIVSGGQYQQITVAHYLESILFDGLNNIGLSVTAEDYGLTKMVGNETVSIATEPLTAMLIMIGIGLGTMVWGARGLANRQF